MRNLRHFFVVGSMALYFVMGAAVAMDEDDEGWTHVPNSKEVHATQVQEKNMKEGCKKVAESKCKNHGGLKGKVAFDQGTKTYSFYCKNLLNRFTLDGNCESAY